MFYKLISNGYNPVAAHHNIALEMTLEILSFGLELVGILYTERSEEFPNAESFHERLYDFSLGYFAAGIYWHTTSHKYSMDHIVTRIKDILNRLRGLKPPKDSKSGVGYINKPVHIVQTEDYTASTLLSHKTRLDKLIAQQGAKVCTKGN
jgi:hypothetical protein